MDFLPFVIIFISVVAVVEGFVFLISWRTNPEKKRINQQLKMLSRQKEQLAYDDFDITRKTRELSSVPWLNELLQKIPRLLPTDRLIEQARAPYTMSVYILAALLLFFVGTLIFHALTKTFLVAVPAGLAMSYLPFLFLIMKKNSRMKKFDAQLPDALDLMARALKAGHAFPGGIQMVAKEFDDPIGIEFAKVVEETNFGVGVEEALRNLANRFDSSSDLKFFAIAVMIQRESGGNLAEILESIARIIRERFKLMGTIRTLSAEGRLSAIILVAIPFFVAFALSIMNPQYITVLATDPIGKALAFTSLVMMAVGIYIMKKTIQIKV
ncbi:type II secretion system F family protein [Syntrophus aciditrophicus]|nr:type II secretion system F family protein [Syntrophus aciditrophicus]OPY16732.1 MAG: Bacterial type II secretion system protein F domain protein [Syntrophus sp. PtaB.Bin075]